MQCSCPNSARPCGRYQREACAGIMHSPTLLLTEHGCVGGQVFSADRGVRPRGAAPAGGPASVPGGGGGPGLRVPQKLCHDGRLHSLWRPGGVPSACDYCRISCRDIAEPWKFRAAFSRTPCHAGRLYSLWRPGGVSLVLLMLVGYHTETELSSGNSGLLPQKNTLPCWASVRPQAAVRSPLFVRLPSFIGAR